jgi:hypothetical protein
MAITNTSALPLHKTMKFKYKQNRVAKPCLITKQCIAAACQIKLCVPI